MLLLDALPASAQTGCCTHQLAACLTLHLDLLQAYAPPTVWYVIYSLARAAASCLFGTRITCFEVDVLLQGLFA
jgi:hypothetical protein